MRKVFQKTFVVLSAFVTLLLVGVVFGRLCIPESSDALSDRKRCAGHTAGSTEDNGQTCTVNGTLHDVELKLLNVISIKESKDNTPERRYVDVGGELIGIRLRTDGIVVIGTDEFENEQGQTVAPARSAGICAGDIITAVNGEPIADNDRLTELIRASSGRPIRLTVRRGDNTLNADLTPQKTSVTGSYKGGLWIRDSAGGIGTLTYRDPLNGTLAALGHGICDNDTGDVLPAENGSMTSAIPSGIVKGAPGSAGQLCGTVSSSGYGTIEVNNEKGIYGFCDSVRSSSDLCPVAFASEVHPGAAQIVCTVTEAGRQYFDIEIEKCSKSAADGKDMVIRVTDTALLSVTGGIVQGMSGSPILQDGRLVGAVTHVFLNDPTGGYGIFAEEMLEQSDAVVRSAEGAAA